MSDSKTIAIYPGTFDPITNGHLDVLRRACKIFDHVILGIAKNESKKPLFTHQERLLLAEENLSDLPNASAQTFDSLTVHFAKKVGATSIVRGMRVVSDFEHEFQMAMMNRSLDENIETIFLMPGEHFFFTSSSLMKQVAAYSDHVERFVPPNVQSALLQKIR